MTTTAEQWAALQYFLDLDNPYLGADQERIMHGQAALDALRSRMEQLERTVIEMTNEEVTVAELLNLRAKVEQLERAHERLRCYHVAYSAWCPGCELRHALGQEGVRA